MTLPEIIKRVQSFKDRTWEIRASNEWISKIEWTILDVPIDVLQEAAKFYGVVHFSFLGDNRWCVVPTVPGSMCYILVFSEPVK
jgi:hypothetical protein